MRCAYQKQLYIATDAQNEYKTLLSEAREGIPLNKRHFYEIVEKNHTLFRDIVPKGESFDCFTQETVNLTFSHLNSVKRKSLNGKTPFEMFSFTYGENITSLLDINGIALGDVIQSPMLLKK